jgi:hypothetical protein
MGDNARSLTAYESGFVSIRCESQRRALAGACEWLIEFERQSQRDGLLPGEVDRSLDQLSEARVLAQRLGHRGLALAVPLGIVPALIDELGERVEHAVRWQAAERVAALEGLLLQLEWLPEAQP